MSERADGLRRRRDLLREELAHVERQLAAEESGSAPLVGPDGQPYPDPETAAEEILSQFRKAPKAVAGKAKSGCLLLYVALLALFLAFAAVGFFLYARSVRGH